MTTILNIRPRRQVTIPGLLLAKVGANVGDKFVAEVENKKIVLKPQKQAFLDAIKTLQKIIKDSGIPEAEIQEAARKDREEYARKNYPYLYGH